VAEETDRLDDLDVGGKCMVDVDWPQLALDIVVRLRY